MGTIIIIFAIIMVLLLLVFGNQINMTIQEKFPVLSNIVSFILSIRSVIVIGSLFIIFALIYRFVPNKKGSSLKQQIPGAIFASIRLVCPIIFLFYLCRYLYRLFYYIWKSCNYCFNHDVVVCNNLRYFVRCRNKCYA